MNAERHFIKAEEFEASQAKLDAVDDLSLLVEGCYFAAHYFIAAGVEWRGNAHPQSHPHGQNIALLKQAGAQQAVLDARNMLERLRSGNVYGGKTNGATASQARTSLGNIKAWTILAHP